MQWQDFVFSINRQDVKSIRGQKVFVDDFEIVGAFGLRRSDFIELCKLNEVTVRQCFALLPETEQKNYDEEIQHLKSLAKFKLQQVDISALGFRSFDEIAISRFASYFPMLSKKLKQEFQSFEQKLLQDYLVQVRRTSFLLSDVWVYIGPFLRSRFGKDPNLIAIANWESANLNLDTKEWIQVATRAVVQMNPNFQICRIDVDVPEFGIFKGLWAFGVRATGVKAQHQLNEMQALILDLLDRDWSMNFEEFSRGLRQLIEVESEKLPVLKKMDVSREIQIMRELNILLVPE